MFKRDVRYICAVAAFGWVCGGSGSAALITDPNDARTWQGAGVGTFAQLYYGSNTLANRQLLVDNNMLDDGLFTPAGYTAATLIKGGAGGGYSTDLTGTGSYGYVQDNGDPVVYASSINNQWIQSGGAAGDTVWDLGSTCSFVAVFPVIDHGPLPQEAIESTIYLSNDYTDAGSWVQAKVVRVFLEGFHPNLGVLWDGFTYVVTTPDGDLFRYASVIHGGPGALINDGDDEINGLMGMRAVPEPGTYASMGIGLAGLLLGRKRRA